MSNKTFKRIAAVSFALLAAAQLSGCGGGDGDSTPTTPPPSGNNPNPPPPPPPPVGSATGVFLDSPVQGLAYTTAPSNVSGVTNANGEFTYNPGDSVTFALGNLVLGAVPAQGAVTPLTVAQALVAASPGGDVETITVNVLAFLQSFDSDGNADNGITLSTAVAGAMASNIIDFTANAGAFTTSLTNLVTNVEASTGADLTVVSREDATEHFVSQVPSLVAGTYVFANAEGVAVTQNTRTLTLFENGTYVYGGHDADPNCNGDGGDEDADGNGVEMGAYAFNPLTGELTFEAALETNGSCGPGGVVGAEAAPLMLEIEDQVLHIEAEDETTHWVAVQTVANGLGGSWALPLSLMQDRPLVVSFFPAQSAGSGRYFLVDAQAGGAGIEEGCYTIDANGAFVADLNSSSCTGAIDTNDAAGFSDPQVAFSAEVDEHGRFRLIDGEAMSDFVRLPLQAYAHADRAGAWYLDAGVAPQDDENLFVMALWNDGHFLLGGVHNDPNCNEGMAYEDGDGNGAEFGQLNVAADALYGLVTATTTTDTNGGCGFHNGSPATQSYMFVRSAVDGSMILYPYDESAGVVLTRVPSTPGELLGAWVTNGDTEHPYMTVFLPEGLLFDVSADEGLEAGLFRWTYAVNGNQLELTSGGDECIDTTGDYDSCGEDIVETPSFTLDGNALSIDYGQEFGVFEYTKITP